MKININENVTVVMNDTLDLPLTARELGVFLFCLSRTQSGVETTIGDLLCKFPELSEQDIQDIEFQFARIEARCSKKFDAATDRLADRLWDVFVREAKRQ